MRSLPNATLAFAVLAVTSSSMCTALERVLPRNIFLETTLNSQIEKFSMERKKNKIKVFFRSYGPCPHPPVIGVAIMQTDKV